MPHRRFLWLLHILFACWCFAADARELEWRALDVDARLDDEGRLHVSERHEMVFTGKWNGGERRFRVGDDQSFRLDSIARLDADGSWVPLTKGSLEQFDHYQWLAAEHALRWRVKRQSDADFDHTVFVHRINYVLSGVLESKGSRQWALDHDFAFRERPGKIEQFRLRLSLDGGWLSERPSPIELERGPLPPGRSVELELPLEYTGAQLQDGPSVWSLIWEWLKVDVGGFFAELRRGIRSDARLWVAALFSTLLAGLARALFQRARERGHFAPLRCEADVDATSIEQHLLPHEPEVIGAVYHQVIGSAEVMAVLARLERERKLTSTLKSNQLELRLSAPRDAFVGHERELIEKLFFAGDHTSIALIRAHYRSFDPAGALRRSLSAKVDAALGTTHRNPEDSLFPTKLTALVAGSVLTLNSADIMRYWFPSWSDGALGWFMFIVIGLGFAVAASRARQFRDRVEPPLPEARFLRNWFVGFGAAVVAFAMFSPFMRTLDLVLHFGSALTLAIFVVWSGWPRRHAAGVALGKRIAEARRYFQAQLETREPQLDDAWYPYMIALGLSPQVDSWFAASRAEPERKQSNDYSSPSGPSQTFGSGSSASTGHEPARWTGGGGRFGGGGASGSWGTEAAELASGVSAPSSSSPSASSRSARSSGSSSTRQGTSRSGGGSGGGW